MVVSPRFKRFVRHVLTQTPLVKMFALLAVLWLVFCWGVYWAEQAAADTTITSYGRALYWGVAAFSTAGIADAPKTGLAQLIGGIWIVLGSLLFFGAIVATITSYFMRPMNRPVNQMVETIEYNLEQLDTLTVEELDLLKVTIDTLIVHMEQVKETKAARNGFPGNGLSGNGPQSNENPPG